MQQLVAKTYPYTNKHQEGCICYLRIFRPREEGMSTTVLISDVKGDSLGWFEKLATEIVKQFGLCPEFTTFFRQDYRFQYPFERLLMFWDGQKFRDPGWETIYDVERLAGFLPEEIWRGRDAKVV